MEEKIYTIENLNVKFDNLNVHEGIKVSNALMSCILPSDSETSNMNIDIGKFSNKCLSLICGKMRVETQDNSGKTFKPVKDIEGLSLFFSNPLVSIEIVSVYLDYLAPFLSCIKGQNALIKNQDLK